MFKISYENFTRKDIEIKYLKKPSKIEYNKKIFEKFGEKQKSYRKKIYIKYKIEDSKNFRDKEKNFQKKLNYYVTEIDVFNKYLNIEEKNKIYLFINNLNLKNPGYYKFIWDSDEKYQIKNNNKKFDYIISTTFGEKIYKKISGLHPCEKEDFLYIYNLYKIYTLFDLLNTNGNAYITIINMCESKTIEFIYLLSAMFEYVYIFSGRKLYCFNFLPNYKINKNDIKKCIKSRYFSIEPKPRLKEFIKEQIQVFTSGYNYYKNSIQKKIFSCSYLNLDIIFGYLPVEFYKFDNIIKYQQEFIKNVLELKSYLFFIQKKQYSFFSNYIYELSSFLNKKKPKNILELDFGWGIQTLFLINSKNVQTIYSIDPFEKEFYKNKNYDLITSFLNQKEKNKFKFSHYNYIYLLPKLLDEFKDTYFDFILLNNFNTSDDFLIKFYYSDKLIQKNKFIFINNIGNYNFRNLIPLILEQYKNYKIHKNYSNSLILQKL
jgi:hypothetical protein